jgi:RNA polymerase sigma-70 factor (ECF subfamily)
MVSTAPDHARAGERATQEQADLLPRVAQGESAAVDACLDRYAGLVWSLARRFCRSTADAEDAVQDIFIDVWKSASRFDASVASETTFIAMIARRRLIDRTRREARTPRLDPVRPELDADDAADAPSERPATRERASVVQRAMSKLTEAQQRVLRLSIIHGLSHEKIAAATGMPLGTVKTHARRGMIRLRELTPAAAAPDADDQTSASSTQQVTT